MPVIFLIVLGDLALVSGFANRASVNIDWKLHNNEGNKCEFRNEGTALVSFGCSDLFYIDNNDIFHIEVIFFLLVSS